MRSVNTPQKKVPFQFMFQDKNKTNVFANPYKCEYCDKEFDKKLKPKKHINNDQIYCLLCEKIYPTQHGKRTQLSK